MNNFVFYSPTEFVFGKDTEIQTGTLAKKYNARKAMIVYGGGSIIRSGLLQRIEDSLQQAGVDYVTLETGLGGRMDATTAVENPVACVITSISLDHMQYLGDTVAKIAGEKAGIIVSGVPVIYDGNDPDAAEVISAKAKEMGSPAYEVKRTDTEIIRNTSSGIDFSFRNVR